MLSKPTTKYNVRFYLNIFESYSIVALVPVQMRKYDWPKICERHYYYITRHWNGGIVLILFNFCRQKKPRTSLDLYLHMYIQGKPKNHRTARMQYQTRIGKENCSKRGFPRSPHGEQKLVRYILARAIIFSVDMRCIHLIKKCIWKKPLVIESSKNNGCWENCSDYTV